MKRQLLLAALCATIGTAALAAAVHELPVERYPLTAGAKIEAGEPVALDAQGLAVPLAGGATAVALAVDSAPASNAVVAVKAGVFGLPAATNLTAAAANGRTLYWADGRATAAPGAVSNALGRCLFLDGNGTAWVKIGL